MLSIIPICMYIRTFMFTYFRSYLHLIQIWSTTHVHLGMFLRNYANYYTVLQTRVSSCKMNQSLLHRKHKAAYTVLLHNYQLNRYGDSAAKPWATTPFVTQLESYSYRTEWCFEWFPLKNWLKVNPVAYEGF